MKFQQWEPDLVTLVSRINAGEIDLQPDFQRQEVWPTQKRRKLIDTVLREWSMPPIHLIESANSTLEVLDGQQRLAAIRDFFLDEITIDGTIAPRSDAISHLNGLKYAQLPAEVRRRLDRYTIRAFRISDFQPEEPSELFYRLNQPTLLTAGEQRNSLYGAARSQLKQLVDLFQRDNGRENIGFSNARLAYDDVLARLLYFLSVGTIAVKATESQISDLFRDETGFANEILETASNAIAYFSTARGMMGRVRLNKASLLSWLLFYSRGAHSVHKEEFLSFFQAAYNIPPALSIAAQARVVFDDRASGRVTDVSSVFLRDACLWTAYVTSYWEGAFSEYSHDCCVALTEMFRDDGPEDFETQIGIVVNVDRWSRLK